MQRVSDVVRAARSLSPGPSSPRMHCARVCVCMFVCVCACYARLISRQRAPRHQQRRGPRAHCRQRVPQQVSARVDTIVRACVRACVLLVLCVCIDVCIIHRPLVVAAALDAKCDDVCDVMTALCRWCDWPALLCDPLTHSLTDRALSPGRASAQSAMRDSDTSLLDDEIGACTLLNAFWNVCEGRTCCNTLRGA
jgi:hypothetical protein